MEKIILKINPLLYFTPLSPDQKKREREKQQQQQQQQQQQNLES